MCSSKSSEYRSTLKYCDGSWSRETNRCSATNSKYGGYERYTVVSMRP